MRAGTVQAETVQAGAWRDNRDGVPALAQPPRERHGHRRHAADHRRVLVGHDHDAQPSGPRSGTQRRFPRAWPSADPRLEAANHAAILVHDASVEVVTVVAIARKDRGSARHAGERTANPWPPHGDVPPHVVPGPGHSSRSQLSCSGQVARSVPPTGCAAPSRTRACCAPRRRSHPEACSSSSRAASSAPAGLVRRSRSRTPSGVCPGPSPQRLSTALTAAFRDRVRGPGRGGEASSKGPVLSEGTVVTSLMCPLRRVTARLAGSKLG